MAEIIPRPVHKIRYPPQDTWNITYLPDNVFRERLQSNFYFKAWDMELLTFASCGDRDFHWDWNCFITCLSSLEGKQVGTMPLLFIMVPLVWCLIKIFNEWINKCYFLSPDALWWTKSDSQSCSQASLALHQSQMPTHVSCFLWHPLLPQSSGDHTVF